VVLGGGRGEGRSGAHKVVAGAGGRGGPAGRWTTDRVTQGRRLGVSVASSVRDGVAGTTGARVHPLFDRPPRRGRVVFQLVPTVLLALLVVAVLPVWRWSRGWGWAPAGMLAMGLATLVLFSATIVPA
jgi:hypothetical protein